MSETAVGATVAAVVVIFFVMLCCLYWYLVGCGNGGRDPRQPFSPESWDPVVVDERGGIDYSTGSVRRADILRRSRGNAAAATWIFRGDHGDAVAATWIFSSGDRRTPQVRGRDDHPDAAAARHDPVRSFVPSFPPV